MFEEPILEPIIRWWRFEKGIREISKNRPLTIVDFGCGPKIRFYYFAKKRGITIRKYIGIDPLTDLSTIQKHVHEKNVELRQHAIDNKLSLSTSIADYVVAFGMIEHVDDPQVIFQEAIRIVKKGGKVIFTTPTPQSKIVLELLAKVGLLSQREIDEHKNYFYKKNLLSSIGNKDVKIYHQTFEFGFNNLLVIEKLGDK